MPPIRANPTESTSEPSREYNYIQFDKEKIYLKISDIARDPQRNSLINSSLFSWLFPYNDCGAKIPHSSVMAFGSEYEFTEDGIIKRPLPKVEMSQVVQIHQFENVLHRSTDVLEKFLKDLRLQFNRSSYSLLSCNCNHFALKLLQFFGIDTEFLQSLPGYGREVLSRSVKVASGIGMGGVIGGIGSLIVSDVGMGIIGSMVAAGPVGAAVATVGTVAVGTGAAGMTGIVIKKLANSRRDRSSNKSESMEPLPPSPSEFDPF